MKFVMTVGLPASGKSTWAEQEVLSKPAGQAVRVNRDLLRTMLHVDRFKGQKTERLVTAARDDLIEIFMADDVPLIISDDTNLHPECEKTFRELCRLHDYEFVIQDFTDVSVKDCIARDLKRTRSVGSKVINKMALQYLSVPYEPPVWDETLPNAVIVDIDGTVAKMNGRSPYDYSLVHTDLPHVPVVRLVQDLAIAGEQIIFCSGREDSCRDETAAWLLDNLGGWVENAPLLMRPSKDGRDDSIIKRELYEEHIEGNYNIRFVLDDRDRVVDAWRAMGLTCFQVEAGDF